jgi:hypothetical protein
MPFYIRHRKISEKIGVFIVEAPNPLAARLVPLDVNGDNYRGYWTSEKDAPHDERLISPPFKTKREAEESPEGYIEDI